MNTRRHAYLAVGFLLLLLFGIINSWSVFMGPLEAEFGWERTQTSSIFTVAMVSFCGGNLAAGALASRVSARGRLALAAALSAVGFAAASLTSSLPGIYFCYGVLCGAAVGIGTNSVMSCVLPWYPDRQGAASGALLMGIGLGSLLLGTPVTQLLEAAGWRSTFCALGAAFGGLLVLGAIVLREPDAAARRALAAMCPRRPETAAAKPRFDGSPGRTERAAHDRPARDVPPRRMLASPAFWCFFAWAALIGAGGMAIVSNAVPAAQDVLQAAGLDAAASALPATLAMGAISASNGVARPCAGALWDALGSRILLGGTPLALGAAMLLCALGAARALFPLLLAGFLLLGAAHGASQSVTSALVRGFYGARFYSANYACAQCNLMAAALIGPTLAGAVHAATGSYLGCYVALLLLAAVAFALARFVRP